MRSTTIARCWLIACTSALPLSSGCLCISPASLQGFACEADGGCEFQGFTCCGDRVCRHECGPADGGREDAGPPDAGVAGCGPSTCEGCCDGPVCRTGFAETTCGAAGATCRACDGVAERCVGGACLNALGIGSACSTGHACVSGFCVEGRCCDRACQEECATCSAAGSEGRCVPRLEGTAAAGCAPFACDGVGTPCPTACLTLHQCAGGRYCDTGSGQCLAKGTNGQPCAKATECASGICADQVCCDAACSGSCDRCNLVGRSGQCSPVDAGDPGVPACAPYTCNGALSDCPITCGSGCPGSTYCSGTYCSAKKDLGLPCSGTVECKGGTCVSGVCCDTGCAGECRACVVDAGAPEDGTCTLLSQAKVCRPASGLCDVEERCGGGAACPSDGFAVEGASCGTSTFGSWSSCEYDGGVCSPTGSRARDRHDPVCHGGLCQPDASTDTDSTACARNTEGAPCGAPTLGTWSACNYGDVCAQSGTRTRNNLVPVCQTSVCEQAATVETDSAGCARPTDGMNCAPTTNGGWSTCATPALDGTCLGTRDRVRTKWTCDAGACGSSAAGESEPCGLGDGEQCAECVCDVGDTCKYICSGCLDGGCFPSLTSDYCIGVPGGC